MEAFLELRRQPSVRSRHITEQSVAARIWAIEEVQECGAGRLDLISHIAVPGDAVCAFLEVVSGCRIACATMHEMYLGESFRCPGCWVDVGRSEVFCYLKGLLDWQIGKVLVPKCNDLLLGYEACKLVLSCITELTDLDTRNFSPHIGRQVPYCCASEKVRECGIGILPRLDSLERLVRWVLGIVPVAGMRSAQQLILDRATTYGR